MDKLSHCMHLILFQTNKENVFSGIKEWDNVVGGGIMPGSLLILTGDPGIGKSTLLLHIAHALAKDHNVFIFSSEESLEQSKINEQYELKASLTKLLFLTMHILKASSPLVNNKT